MKNKKLNIFKGVAASIVFTFVVACGSLSLQYNDGDRDLVWEMDRINELAVFWYKNPNLEFRWEADVPEDKRAELEAAAKNIVGVFEQLQELDRGE